jgi:tRNA-2-methylthio-N6-dimethylallyladenosine synthase
VREIVDAIDANESLCNHVHLPVQSGSSKILESMQRLYTREEYMQRIAWMRAAKRPIAISTDIIVGFPGETEADFEETLALLDEIQYDSIFGFKYSRRPNTAALALDAQIAEEEKIRRLAIVQEKQRGIQMQRHASYVGSMEECLVEGFNKATGQWIGRTSQNKTLNFLRSGGDADLEGSYVQVRVTRAGPNSLAGEWVS